MSILFQLSQYVDLGRLPGEIAPLVALPPLSAARFAAAGRTAAFLPEARSFRLRNLGDKLWIRVVPVTSPALLAGDNVESEWLESGDVYDFMLDRDQPPAYWQLDVRAR